MRYIFLRPASQKLLMIALMLLLVSGVQSQSWLRRHSAFEDGDDFHFGYISGSVGYSMLQTSLPNAMPHGKAGGSIGLGYEFRNSGLWTSVGVQMSFHRSSLEVSEFIDDHDGLDTQNKPNTFHYRVNQIDNMEWNYIDIPVLLGYYVRGFHVGAGVKVSYALNPNVHTKGVYNLSATNHFYQTTFENMPEHGYTDYPYEGDTKVNLNVGASLIGEIGYDLLSSLPTSSRLCHVLKVAFYFEYGLNNQLREREGETWKTRLTTEVEPGKWDATKIQINPHINTFAQPARTVPFFTGVKLTYMIGGSRTARVGFHHGCMCYN